MPSLKDVKMKIVGVGKTKQITKAMNMVASAKLRGAQARIERFRPYAGKYRQVLAELARKVEGTAHPLLAEHEEKKNCAIVLVTSDRGLCGSYNAMIARTAMNRIEELKAAGKEVKIITLGTRGYNALKRHYADEIVRSAESAANRGVDYEEAEALAAEVLTMFGLKEIDVCEVVYSHFRSAMSRDVKSRQILPLTPEMLTDELPGEMSGGAFFESEPESGLLLAQLMPLVFKEAVFDIMINSQASEQGARMTSMDNATRNAGDMISRLTLRYNRMRQTAITTELVEIIAGAEAI